MSRLTVAIRKSRPAVQAWARAILRPLKRARLRRRLRAAALPADWDSRTFSEKIAWRCQNPDLKIDYAVWADKYRAKKLVSAFADSAEVYFYTRRVREIDASRLPATFVMKATHGWNMSLLVEDGIVQASNRSLEGAGARADTSLLRNIATDWLQSREEEQRQQEEVHYQFVQPGILIEQLVAPIDYELQLFLFNGRCRLAMALYRGFHHRRVRHRLYGENWQLLEPGSETSAASYERESGEIVPPPIAMLEALKTLCQSIDHVRADFFFSGGTYYFAEFTFMHNGLSGPGWIGKYDDELGAFWLR